MHIVSHIAGIEQQYSHIAGIQPQDSHLTGIQPQDSHLTGSQQPGIQPQDSHLTARNPATGQPNPGPARPPESSHRTCQTLRFRQIQTPVRPLESGFQTVYYRPLYRTFHFSNDRPSGGPILGFACMTPHETVFFCPTFPDIGFSGT